ncbi:MAG: hypothetical protein IJV74_06875 [Clostridia bacterium]|nr:hypothetical protein [Clostridia bacterium]
MDSTQIHTAMREQLPVIYDGRRYDRIIEYISWYDTNKKRRLSAVLLLGRSSYRVPAEKVELAEK